MYTHDTSRGVYKCCGAHKIANKLQIYSLTQRGQDMDRNNFIT